MYLRTNEYTNKYTNEREIQNIFRNKRKKNLLWEEKKMTTNELNEFHWTFENYKNRIGRHVNEIF